MRLRRIVMELGETLLNCDDLDLGASRQFRLERIETAEILGARPPAARAPRGACAE